MITGPERESALTSVPRCSCPLGCNSPCNVPLDCDLHGPAARQARVHADVPPSMRTMLNLNANRRIE